MTLMELMRAASDDTWFYVSGISAGGRDYTFYNADFLVRDCGVMELVRPLLRRKVFKISVDMKPDRVSWTNKFMLVVELEGK